MALTGQEGTELPATALSAGTPLNTAEALSIVRQSVGVLSPYRLICNRPDPRLVSQLSKKSEAGGAFLHICVDFYL
jgi:hypothetical protein